MTTVYASIESLCLGERLVKEADFDTRSRVARGLREPDDRKRWDVTYVESHGYILLERSDVGSRFEVRFLGSAPFFDLLDYLLRDWRDWPGTWNVLTETSTRVALLDRLIRALHGLNVLNPMSIPSWHVRTPPEPSEQVETILRDLLRHPAVVEACLRDHGLVERISPSNWVADRFAVAERVIQFLSLNELLDEGVTRQVLQEVSPIDLGVIYDPESIFHTDNWTTADSLNFRAHKEAILAFLQHPSTSTPVTVGITGPWGAGKTSLMRMVAEELKSTAAQNGAPASADGDEASLTIGDMLRRLKAASPLRAVVADGNLARGGRVVWFNPWFHANTKELLAGLANEITSQVAADMSPIERERFWLELLRRRADTSLVRVRLHRYMLKDLLPSLLQSLLVGALVVMLGVISLAWNAAAEWAESAVRAAPVGALGTIAFLSWRYWKQRSRSARSLLRSAQTLDSQGPMKEALGIWSDLIESGASPNYDQRAGSTYLTLQDLEHVLAVVSSSSQPVTVFIDDLDRCSSSTVVQVIEAINVFLAGGLSHCNFVVALDMHFIAGHLDAQYANLEGRIDRSAVGWRFLEKVIQVAAPVPRMRDVDIDRYLEGLVRGPDDLRIASATAAEKASDLEELGEELRGAEVIDGHSLARFEDILVTYLDDSDQIVRDALGSLAKAHLRNPRQVKRLVNSFRFMAFVQRSRQRQGLPVPGGPQHVAKLALMGVLWPEFVDCLMRDHRDRVGTNAGSPANLESLESALNTTEPDRWSSVVGEALREGGVPTHWMSASRVQGFGMFLASEPKIGTWAPLFL